MTILSTGITRAIAVGTAIISITSIAKNSAHIGLSEAKAEETKHLTDTFMKHNSGQADVFEEKVRKWYWEFLLDQKLLPTYYKIKSVAETTVKQTARYLLPLGLAAGAWCKGPIGKICAGALVVLGARFFLCDIMGIDKEKKE